MIFNFRKLSHQIDISPASPYIKNDFTLFIQKKTIIKSENLNHHICSFFLPIHIPSKSLFLVHHKKARDWIPPGGHIEMGENPIDTIYREFAEELRYTLTDENIEFFTVSIKCICSKNTSCKTHYDFWYIVQMKQKIPFSFSQSEFINAKWITDKHISLTQSRDYRVIEQMICTKYFV